MFVNNTIPEQDCVIDNKNAGTQDRWKDRIHFLPDKAENGFLCLNSYSFNSIIIEHYVKEVGISYDYLEQFRYGFCISEAAEGGGCKSCGDNGRGERRGPCEKV